MSLVLRTGLALALTASLLASCGKRSQPEAARVASASEATSSVGEPAGEAAATPASAAPTGLALRNTKPIDAYLVLGGKIKTCWFNPIQPLLPRHMYRADVSPDGDNAKIAVYEMTREKRPGAIAYLIVLQQEPGYTSVKTQNRKMPQDASARLRHDVERWTHGDGSCKSGTAAR